MTKNSRITERKCRKNIGQMLSLMGFKDNNITAAVTVRSMLAKLREIEEKNDRNKFTTTTVPAVGVQKNKNRSTNKRIVFKLGGKRCVIDKESPLPVIVPLKPPHSKTLVESCNKNMELKDSRNINPSCSSRMMIVGDHDDDVIMELMKADDTELLNSRKNVGCSRNPKFVETYSRSNTTVSSQNPNTSSSQMNVGDQEDDVRMEFKNGNHNTGSRNNVVVYSENPDLNMIRDELRVYNVKEFIKSIGGTKAKLFFKKKLTNTDVQGNQGRLLMPGKQVENSDYALLNSKDTMIMERNDNNLSVTVFDPRRHEWKLNLTQWTMGRQINYVLKTQWRKLVETNKLKEHMIIQVWSFRDVQEKLCFAVVRV